MRISGTFICERHEEYGTIGWRPLNMKKAEPFIAVGHDLLEHFKDDDGSLEDELMAGGAIILLRGLTGLIQKNGNVNKPEVHIGSQISSILNYAIGRDEVLSKPPRTYKADEEFESFAEEAYRCGISEVEAGELYDDGTEKFSKNNRGFTKENVIGWWRIGYRRARRRYRNADPYAVGLMIEKIDDKIRRYIEEIPGMKIRVTADIDNFSVYIEET